MSSPPLLFTLPEYGYLAEALVEETRLEVGRVEVAQFPDGERYQRITDSVAERHVVLVGGTVSDAATLMLYDWASAAVKYGARRLTLVVPYFGYSTMERAARPGEVVVAKSRARLFSSIPIASQGNRIVLLDLHSEGIPYYFEGGLTAQHVRAKPLVVSVARRLGGGGAGAGDPPRDASYVVASTDAGRAKWVESIAGELAVDAAFVYKRRLDGASTEIAAVSAHVTGRRVVIYDDMIRTGGSLINAARAYRAAGATELIAVATHGLFVGDTLERLKGTGLFEHIVCTDSHPRARQLDGAGLEVVSVASLLAPAINQ